MKGSSYFTYFVIIEIIIEEFSSAIWLNSFCERFCIFAIFFSPFSNNLFLFFTCASVFCSRLAFCCCCCFCFLICFIYFEIYSSLYFFGLRKTYPVLFLLLFFWFAFWNWFWFFSFFLRRSCNKFISLLICSISLFCCLFSIFILYTKCFFLLGMVNFFKKFLL